MLLTNFIITLIIFVVCYLLVLIRFYKQKIVLFLLIPAMLYMAATTYFTIQSLYGWPTEQVMPKNFYVEWYKIDKPDNKIYIWISERNKSPRNHVIPYSKEMADSLDRNRNRMAKRARVKGERGKKRASGIENKVYKYKFIIRPENRLPEKF